MYFSRQVIPSTLAFLWLRLPFSFYWQVYPQGRTRTTLQAVSHPSSHCPYTYIYHGNPLLSLAEYRWQVNLKRMETLTSPAWTKTEGSVSRLLLWVISMLPLSPLSVSITLEKKYHRHLSTVSTAVIQEFVDCLVTPQTCSLCWDICCNPRLMFLRE